MPMDAATQSPRQHPRAAIVAVHAVAVLGLLASGALPAQARDTRQPPADLRDTGLYASWTEKRIRPDNLAFSPQYPLWTDGATKRRWVHIPRGKWVDASRPDDWVFPPGTRFWKEFGFGRPVETRYIERLRDGTWLYATYVWSEDGSEARLAPQLGVAVSHEIRPGVHHSIPGAADCRACHEGKTSPVLGFDALQLSPERDPLAPHGAALAADEIDLRALVARGLVRGLPARFLAEPPRIVAPTPAARAAIGYLHANCGGCHNDSGPLGPLGMSLAHALGAGQGEPAIRTTVGQPTRAPVPGLPAGDRQRIAPGHPEASAVLLRMRSRHPLLQMPPLGTKLVDAEAVALLERWIAEDLPATPISPASKPQPNNEENRP
jgi:hypothetical protein